MKGAQEMPLIRAARQRAIQEHELQEQQLRAKTTELQARTGKEPPGNRD